MKKSLFRTACEDELTKREFARRAGIALNGRRTATDGTDATDKFPSVSSVKSVAKRKP